MLIQLSGQGPLLMALEQRSLFVYESFQVIKSAVFDQGNTSNTHIIQQFRPILRLSFAVDPNKMIIVGKPLRTSTFASGYYPFLLLRR